jgi:site-specific DNA recombinase
MPLNKLRAAIYCRVSSDPKNIGRSVSEQEQECHWVCEREGWDVVTTFIDQDRSASRYAKREREHYQQLKGFIAQRKCDVVVTWEASRFQRDLEDYVALRELCRRYNVLWSYSGRTFDLSRTDDRLMTGIDALLAERESDVTRERVLRAMRANASQGKPHGKLPFGYRREYDPSTGALLRQVIDEDQAKLIREAAKRIANGEPPYRICNEWNTKGIKSPRGALWGISVLKRILTNPIYIAKRVHQGQIVGEATWPPILDEQTFYRIQARYGDPERSKFSDSQVKYLLTGIAKCGVCGGRILVRKPKGYPSYTCVDKFCVARKIIWVDELVSELVIARLSLPDALAVFDTDEDSEVTEKLELIADIRGRLNSFYDDAAEGKLSTAALTRIESRLVAELEHLERQVRRVGVPEALYELVADPATIWPALDIVARRQIVKALLEVRILRGVGGSHRFRPESVEISWRGQEPDE